LNAWSTSQFNVDGSLRRRVRGKEDVVAMMVRFNQPAN
jgi:hypothetical protein